MNDGCITCLPAQLRRCKGSIRTPRFDCAVVELAFSKACSLAMLCARRVERPVHDIIVARFACAGSVPALCECSRSSLHHLCISPRDAPLERGMGKPVLLAKCQTCLSATKGLGILSLYSRLTPFQAQTASNFQLSTWKHPKRVVCQPVSDQRPARRHVVGIRRPVSHGLRPMPQAAGALQRLAAAQSLARSCMLSLSVLQGAHRAGDSTWQHRAGR